MTNALDVSAHTMGRASNELHLVGQLIHMDTLLTFSVGLVLLHHNLSGSKPTDLHKFRLSNITPEPNLLAKAVLRIQATVFGSQSSSKTTVSINFDHGLLCCRATSKVDLKVFISSELYWI